MKNYIDPGVINKQMMSSNDKLLQEYQYLDTSVFRGEVVLDEETRCMYKEGQGRFERSKVNNYCYYK